jgi:hypothetical protein
MQICATGCSNAKLDLSVPPAVAGGSALRFTTTRKIVNADCADWADRSGLESHFAIFNLVLHSLYPREFA